MDITSLFSKHTVEESKVLSVKLGEIDIKIKKVHEGWVFYFVEHEGINVQPELSIVDDVEGFEIKQLVQSGKGNTIRINPAMPIKPIVFKNNNINILPGQSLKLFVVIPVSLQFYKDIVADNNLLYELSTKRLSDTWFGDPDSGEVAFSIGTNFYHNFESIELKPNEAICPVKISNNSSTVLEVQRLIIRVNELHLYELKGKIVTSLVDIEYKGRDQVSNATYKVDKSIIKDKSKTLANPRTTGSSLLKLNFHFIKNIYQ